MRDEPDAPAFEDEDEDEVRTFVLEVLGTGLMLTDLLGGLLDDMPEDAFPGEDAGEVLLEMLVGTARPAADAAGASALRQATALVGAVADRTLLDLEAALELARER